MHHSEIKSDVRKLIAEGTVIPAHPLALDANRALDIRHQRALTRYYIDAGAGGLAVGVHTTQFAIREPKHALLRPVLQREVRLHLHVSSCLMDGTMVRRVWTTAERSAQLRSG